MAMLRVLLLLLTLAGSLAATAEVAVPPLEAPVTDLTATLTPDQVASLDQKLKAFERRKGSQIAILIVPTTAPETIEQYGLRVVEQWKLGRKKVDDGVLLVIAMNDRTMRIEVGYGFEGALNDAIANRILSEVIGPQFQRGDYYAGIIAGIDAIIRIAGGEPLPAASGGVDNPQTALPAYGPLVLILILVVGGVLRSVLGRSMGALFTGVLTTGVIWLLAGPLLIAVFVGLVTAALMLAGLGGHGLGGYYGGHYGGHHGGGGGFRGGGGGFGGGGASGRW